MEHDKEIARLLASIYEKLDRIEDKFAGLRSAEYAVVLMMIAGLLFVAFTQ